MIHTFITKRILPFLMSFGLAAAGVTLLPAGSDAQATPQEASCGCASEAAPCACEGCEHCDGDCAGCAEGCESCAAGQCERCADEACEACGEGCDGAACEHGAGAHPGA